MSKQESPSGPGLPATATLLACPYCNYVAGPAILTSRVSQPCPKCGQTGARLLFPDISGAELLRMIELYWMRASEAVSKTNQQLVEAVAAQIGRVCSGAQVVGTAREVQAILSQAHTTTARQDTFYNKSLSLVRSRLALESDEDVQSVWLLLVSYSDAQDDHKVVVTLTHTLLEVLLDDLLVTLLVVSERGPIEAEEHVEALRTFSAQTDAFEAVTHMSLSDAMGATTHPWFYFAWQDVRQKRNRFLHGEPFAVGQKTARQAYKLAKHAVSMFAQLQNTHGLRTSSVGGAGSV